MTVFLLVAVLGLAAALLLLLRPFIWKSTRAQTSHRQLNAAIYREQLVRLDQDLAQGTIGAEDHAQARAELQRRVLEDTREEDAAAAYRSPKRTMAAITLAVPLAAAGLYMLIGSPALLRDGGGGHSAAASQQDIERMVAALAAKLEKEPDNLKGWAMLARSYKVMGKSVEAERAFDKAASFIEDDAQMLANYADVAAGNAGGNFAGKPALLIQKALKADPDNPMALWLAGTASFKSGEYDKAIGTWERLVSLLPPGSEDAQMLQGAIDEARAKGGKSAGTKTAAPSGAVAAAATPVTPAAPPRPAAPGAGPADSRAAVTGTVELDASLKGKAAPGDIVMVIARLPGTRMPIAVQRVRAADLPMKFTLDDSLAMSPETRISTAKEVEVEARVSKSGMAKPESGDLFSPAQTVKVGASGVALRVAQVRP